jgi:hypothetical protein
MELNEEYHRICLKNKLQTNLKYYLLGANKSYNLLYRVIEILKNKYSNDVNLVNDLERLRQSITNYTFGNEILRVEDWIINWNNELLINDLNNFADTSRNYEMEEQIKDLQKQLYEVKEINIEQNKRLELIEERVNK